jgi:hypothetical protein
MDNERAGSKTSLWLFYFKSRCPSVIVNPKVAMKKLQFWQDIDFEQSMRFSSNHTL